MAEKKEQKEVKKKKTSKRWENYDASSGLKRKNKFCPKCGSGIFLAEHMNRLTCGSCSYTEFKSKKSEA